MSNNNVGTLDGNESLLNPSKEKEVSDFEHVLRDDLVDDNPVETILDGLELKRDLALKLELPIFPEGFLDTFYSDEGNAITALILSEETLKEEIKNSSSNGDSDESLEQKLVAFDGIHEELSRLSEIATDIKDDVLPKFELLREKMTISPELSEKHEEAALNVVELFLVTPQESLGDEAQAELDQKKDEVGATLENTYIAKETKILEKNAPFEHSEMLDAKQSENLATTNESVDSLTDKVNKLFIGFGIAIFIFMGIGSYTISAVSSDVDNAIVSAEVAKKAIEDASISAISQVEMSASGANLALTNAVTDYKTELASSVRDIKALQAAADKRSKAMGQQLALSISEVKAANKQSAEINSAFIAFTEKAQGIERKMGTLQQTVNTVNDAAGVNRGDINTILGTQTKILKTQEMLCSGNFLSRLGHNCKAN